MILRAVMSHAQMNRIDCRELAHRQAYSRSDVYGECRDNEQACLRVCRHGRCNREENLNLLL